MFLHTVVRIRKCLKQQVSKTPLVLENIVALNTNLSSFYRNPVLELMMFKVLFSFQILDVWIWLHMYSVDIQEFSFMTIFHLSLTFQITPDIAYER